MSEDQLRQLLTDAAQLAPTTLERPVRMASPWRARALIAGAALAAASVATAAVALTRDSAPQHTLPAAASETTGPAGDGTQVVSQRGLTLNVPEAWAINKTQCGTPVADTVTLGVGFQQACLYPGDGHAYDVVSYVSINDASAGEHCTGEVVERISTCTDPMKDQLGRTVVVVSAPSTHQMALVSSASPETARAIAGTARLADVVDGCQVSPASLEPSSPTREGARDQLVPNSPTTVRGCSYQDRLLVATGRGTDPTELVAQLNSLSPGLGMTANNASLQECDRVKGDAIRLVFGYESGPSLDVWVRTSGCGRVIGFDSGARTGFPTDASFLPLFKVVMIGGYVNPSNLQH